MFKKKRKFKLVRIGRKRSRKKKTKKINFLMVFTILMILFMIPAGILIWRFHQNIRKKVPNISNIENIQFAEATVITDRNGTPIYKVFEENRKYVGYDKISPNMVNAIVSIEDKKFWTNPGIDITGIFRAGLHDIRTGEKHGGSTITQQLIKNLLLTNDRTINRKLKEMILSLRLNNYLKSEIKNKYGNMEESKLNRRMKERILEMYLNYVFFGNNFYGVESACQWYFGVSASEMSVLQASILAGIPKSPTAYNPQKNPINVIWDFVLMDKNNAIVAFTGDMKESAINTYKDHLEDTAFSMYKNERDIVDALSPKDLKYKGYTIKYIPGRKDRILARMYEDNYINKSQLIKAVVEGLTLKIKESKIEIKAPHFVFYVLDELEKKYGTDVVSKAWWTVKTSIDLNIQKLAQEAVDGQTKYLASKWANNTALLYMDSSNGDILAYIGSKDYYNKDISGKVDMIKAKRQPGSTIKPLMYTAAFMKHPFTPDSPIYDVPFDIADKGNTFNNFDGLFEWLLPMKKALSHSRNIPASKMYFLWWWEVGIKNFLLSLWLRTINPNIYYGYPLAIWSAEVRMLDMARAYSHLSSLWEPALINPILEITWPDGSIIYKKKNTHLEKVVPSSIAYMLWTMLSNPANRPASWNYIMNIKWLTMATKSGTTNIKNKNGTKSPRDGWLISYTPSKVFIAWAGNTKWEPMNQDAYGGWTAGKVWRDFVLKLKAQWLIKNEAMKMKSLSDITIDIISGKKAGTWVPPQLTTNTIASNENLPGDDDGTVKPITIDALCNGKVWKYTPDSDKIEWYLINPHSNKPNDPKWETETIKWWKTKWIIKYKNILGKQIFLGKEPTKECEQRKIVAKKWLLEFQIVKPGNNVKASRKIDIWIVLSNAPFPIDSTTIYIDNKQYITISGTKEILKLNIANNYLSGPHTIRVEIKDKWWYIKSDEVKLNIVGTDNTKPYLFKKENHNGRYVYIFMDDLSRVEKWTLYCDGKETNFWWPIKYSNNWDCDYKIEDSYGNKTDSRLSWVLEKENSSVDSQSNIEDLLDNLLEE